MPIFQYKVVGSNTDDEILEIEQEIGAEELKIHPITGESIKKVIGSVSLTLKHSASEEKAVLKKENLEKKGFSVFQKDSSNSSKYYRTAGNFGPNEINLN